jgi:radical SAM protein with 4Fe4S-binding SPASM domain
MPGPLLNLLMTAHDRFVPPERRAQLREGFDTADYYWSRVRLGRDRFTQVEVETNTGCNRKCRICPRHKHEREAGFMEDGLYRTLLEQLGSIGFSGRFSPVFYNEPLLDPRLTRLMREARQYLPKSTIVLFTNGSLLTTENMTELAEAGVDSFIVSQYTGNLKADEAGFLEAQAALSPKVKRRIRYRTLGDEDPLSTSGGLVPVRHPVTKSKCMQASLNCVVDFRGDVVLCCNDYYGEHTFGNVGREHIVDIWNKPGFRKLRQRLRGGHFDLEICKACASGTLA